MRIILLFLMSFNVYADICESIFSDTLYLSSDETTLENSREFITKKLQDLKFDVSHQKFADGINIIAKKSSAPKLILSAHYDRLTECTQRQDSITSRCSGASDDSAGVALVLSLAQKFKNEDIAIIIFDAEERGLLGSKYFVENPTFSLKKVKAIFNFDIIGLNLFDSLADSTLSMGTETGGKLLKNQVMKAFTDVELWMHPFTYSLTQNRADIASFINARLKIPIVHFTDGDGSVYHTSSDEVDFLNFPKITKMEKALSNLIPVALSSQYRYKRPSFFSGYALPKKSDVKTAIELSMRADDFDTASNLKKLEKGLFTPKKMMQFNQVARNFIEKSRNQDFIPLGQQCHKRALK